MAGSRGVSLKAAFSNLGQTLGLPFAGTETMAGNKWSSTWQDLSTTPAAASVGNCGTFGGIAIGVLIVAPLSGAGNIVISKDSGVGPSQILSVVVPGGIPAVLTNLPAMPFISMSTGTGTCLVTACEA